MSALRWAAPSLPDLYAFLATVPFICSEQFAHVFRSGVDRAPRARIDLHSTWGGILLFTCFFINSISIYWVNGWEDESEMVNMGKQHAIKFFKMVQRI